jgi:subtilisin-like proprotein convertase family protein
MNRTIGLAAVAAAGLVTSMASAFPVNTYSAGPGLALAIPDNGYNGSLASMATSSIIVPDIGDNTIQELHVTIGMSHTFIGDLTIKLVGPGGQVLTLLNRPGSTAADNGVDTPFGSGDDFIFANLVSYDDDGTIAAENLGTLAGTVIPNGTVATPGPIGALAGELTNFAGYDGLSAVGTWTLHLGDSAGADLGTLDQWSITIDTIPAPSALALLGLAGLVSRGRRRD